MPAGYINCNMLIKGNTDTSTHLPRKASISIPGYGVAFLLSTTGSRVSDALLQLLSIIAQARAGFEKCRSGVAPAQSSHPAFIILQLKREF
jgi:hypothetical protein